MKSTSKSTVVKKAILGRTLSIIGYVVAVPTLLFILVAVIDSAFSGVVAFLIVLLLVLLAIVIVFIIIGAKTTGRVKRFRRYVKLISDQKLTSLKHISKAMKKSDEFVKNDLQYMIEKGFFTNAAIDYDTGEIIVRCMSDESAASATSAYIAAQPAPPEYETFVCSGCSATGRKIKNKTGSCDYCGCVYD